MMANTSVTPCTTGKSRWKIELIISWPIPGIAKICSMMTVAPIRKPMLMASTVTAGMTAFSSTCRWYSGREEAEHAGPQAADNHRGERERDGQAGQEHRLQVPGEAGTVPADRENVQRDRERVDQQEPQPERGHAQAD